MTTTDPIRQAAADWFARLQDEDAALETWQDFQAWLEAAPAHREAYARLEALWVDLEDPAAASALDPVVTPLRPRARRPPPWLIAGGAIAASVAALLVAPRWLTPPSTDYVTGRGEVRDLTLADGSRLTLAGDTKVRVSLRRHRRDVTLVEGQAAFDVAHRDGDPFVVALGDQTVRVIGTEFDVARRDGRTAVTVRRGVVAVAQAAGGEMRLTRGQQVLHAEGSATQTVRAADPEAVLAWREGKLVYDAASLAQVVADFNRYGDTPIRVDPSAAGVTVTGVFQVDRADAMVERLARFSGLVIVRRPGVIVLKAP